MSSQPTKTGTPLAYGGCVKTLPLRFYAACKAHNAVRDRKPKTTSLPPTKNKKNPTLDPALRKNLLKRRKEAEPALAPQQQPK